MIHIWELFIFFSVAMLLMPLLALISSSPPPGVTMDAAFNVSTVTGIVYGQWEYTTSNSVL